MEPCRHSLAVRPTRLIKRYQPTGWLARKSLKYMCNEIGQRRYESDLRRALRLSVVTVIAEP